ncbi:MAG TPA: VWA domain-containing protein, partial [Marisediminicola sp.]|nr:VWA domain-containing protein [Marisediminicola sp.]
MRRFLATIMLLLAGSAPASAQQPAEPRIELRYLDARGYPTIEAFFAVNDSDVDARSVVVEEDGRPLDAEVEGLRNEPIAVEVVLDSSSSMAGGKAGSVMAAMGQLLDIVRPFDVVGVVVFADTPAIAAPPGTSRDAVVSALKAYAPNGGTAFRDAVSLSIDQVAASPPARKVVIALSDGLDNRSAVDQEALIAKALANGVAVWTVGFGEPGAPADAGIDVASLEQLASRTGGQALITPDEATIRHGFRNVAAEVQSEFHVSVRSPRAADGTTRSLRFVFGGDEVTVKYNPGGVVPIPVPSVDAPASALGGPSIAARVSVASRWWLAGLGLLAAAAGVLLYGDAAL